MLGTAVLKFWSIFVYMSLLKEACTHLSALKADMV